jgi:hypothetical protein
MAFSCLRRGMTPPSTPITGFKPHLVFRYADVNVWQA